MSTEFWVGLILAVVANVAAIGALYGRFSTRLDNIEKKVDKHNNLVERMYKCEGEIRMHETQLRELKEKEN